MDLQQYFDRFASWVPQDAEVSKEAFIRCVKEHTDERDPKASEAVRLLKAVSFSRLIKRAGRVIVL